VDTAPSIPNNNDWNNADDNNPIKTEDPFNKSNITQ
jgi:hypothetical protein